MKELNILTFIQTMHDMQKLLHVQKKVLSEIIRAYEAHEQSSKQVFIVFDWLDTYDAVTKKTMMGHCVL